MFGQIQLSLWLCGLDSSTKSPPPERRTHAHVVKLLISNSPVCWLARNRICHDMIATLLFIRRGFRQGERGGGWGGIRGFLILVFGLSVIHH